MYLVNEPLPENCFNCKFRTRCNVWEKFLKLPFDKGEILMDDMELLKPRQFTCCKIFPIPYHIGRFYYKWIKGKCPHICSKCRHRLKCEIYLNGR